LDPYSILLVKDLNGKSDQMDLLWRRDNFTSTQALPVMQMQIMSQWESFSDYIAAMGSKYRIRAKAARKKGRELVVQRWNTQQVAENINEIMNLYQQVYQRARFRLQKVNEEYFINLSMMESDKFIFNAWLENGQLVGFSTMFLDQKRADAHLIGLNYDTNKSHSLYLNMLYQYVEDAILSRVELLDLGRTAMEIKSTVGAIPIDLSVYLKLKNPLLNGLACMMAGNTVPENWIQRHPFRQN
jgi:predicted N-acyltransferase